MRLQTSWKKLGPGGIYKTFIPDVGLGELYKFLIITPDGRKLYKADPFANQGRYVRELLLLRQILPILNGRTASGLKKENAQDPEKAPVAIYECHIGSG